MKAKVSRGGGFRGVADYLLDKEENELIGGNLSGNTAREIAKEFSIVRQLRPDIEKPVWHTSLSLPINEHVSNEKWNNISETFLKDMGFDIETTPFIVVKHKDTNFEHVHIVASRINLKSELWLGKWEAVRAIEVTNKLEKEFNLIETKGKRSDTKALKGSERKMKERTGAEMPREKLQRLINEALDEKPNSRQEFEAAIAKKGILFKANVAPSTGRMNGYSFMIENIAFKGSQLGKNYAWAQLDKIFNANLLKFQEKQALQPPAEVKELHNTLLELVPDIVNYEKEFKDIPPLSKSEINELIKDEPPAEKPLIESLLRLRLFQLMQMALVMLKRPKKINSEKVNNLAEKMIRDAKKQHGFTLDDVVKRAHERFLIEPEKRNERMLHIQNDLRQINNLNACSDAQLNKFYEDIDKSAQFNISDTRFIVNRILGKESPKPASTPQDITKKQNFSR